MINLFLIIFLLIVLFVKVDVLGIVKYVKMEIWLILMWKLFNKKNVGVIIVLNKFLFCWLKESRVRKKKWRVILVLLIFRKYKVLILYM